MGIMERLLTSLGRNRGLTRRQVMALGATSLATWLLSPMQLANAVVEEDLEMLSHMPQRAEREGPLLVFRDFVADPDGEIEQHIRLQLSQRKDLFSLLKKKIGFEKRVRLSVEDIQVRLMFVPQLQEGPAAAYHRYCLGVTDYFFEVTRTENFYTAITSPTERYPILSETGISAFLVHRLAKDYRAVCRFTAESGASIKFKATGTIFSNHLGAVDLEIELLAADQFSLKRKPFTIWQNNSNGFSTLMAVPVEETLHYYLGAATDRHIYDIMQQAPPENLAAAKLLAEEWMAVEESVVGGLTDRVLSRYCERYRMTLPLTVGAEMQSASTTLPQYRYRDRGIQLVQDLGLHEAMALYLDSPASFRDRLVRRQKA